MEQALNATTVLFDGGGVESLDKLSGEELERLFRDAPTTELPLCSLEEGMSVVELAVKTGAANTRCK